MEETKEEPVPKKDFISRDYQVELFEIAKDKNTILYLPTGSGKTFIATLLIKHFNNIPGIVDSPLECGGKRTFFLVNTVALVEQQVKQIGQQTTLAISGYSGDMGVDLWESSIWMEQFNTRQILVMTCQIFLDLIEKAVIGLKHVNLLIFDECHRGVTNHPMRMVMKRFEGVPVSQQPRILGLTATLLNGNIKANRVPEEIRNLETTYMAKIATSTYEDMVKEFSTNPLERKFEYSGNDRSGYCYQKRDAFVKNCMHLLSNLQIDEVDVVPKASRPANAFRIDSNSMKTNKRLKNVVEDIQVNMDDLGVYGGSMALLAHMVQMQQLMPNAQLVAARIACQQILANCTQLRRTFEIEMRKGGLTDAEVIKHYSSDKVLKLFALLRRLKPTDSAIIFVKRRFTAKIMYYIVKNAAECDPRYKHIKTNYIVGYTIGNPFKDTRENYVQRQYNKKVMNLFNQNELNVLFASNVVEEGIDIRQCNNVIMFDTPGDFRSYIQSKGRARDKESNYIIMCTPNDRFLQMHMQYLEVEEALKQILYGGRDRLRKSPTREEITEAMFIQTPGLEPYKPFGDDGPVVTCISAIATINRYFTSLKADKFTKVTPFWFLRTEGVRYKCFLRLPMKCKIPGLVEGTWQSTKEDAKRSVALEAVKILHENKELDDPSLLPFTSIEAPNDKERFTPNYDTTESFQEKMDINNELKKVNVGTKKHKRVVEKKWAECLSNCCPIPNQKVYVHVLDVRPIYSPQANNRLAQVHKAYSSPSTFAILSTKLLPKISSFPLYTSTGELDARIGKVQTVTLSGDQLGKLAFFHFTLFDSLLKVSKSFLMRDTTNRQNSFIIAPVIVDASGNLQIDWTVVKESKMTFPTIDIKPSEYDRKKLIVNDDNYLNKIVTPWYRTEPEQKYLVTKVCYDMSENSPFPSVNFATYKKYFNDKYKIDTFLKNQPLLEVRPISSRLDCTKPRALTKQLKRKKNEEHEDYEVWLLPEFCHVFPIPGTYWLKGQLLPSILHRIGRLCVAEELRLGIAKDTGKFLLELPSGMNWGRLKGDVSLEKNKGISEKQQDLTPISFLSKNANPYKDPENPWGKEEVEPVDLERNMETANLFEIVAYCQFIKKPLYGETTANTRAINKLAGAKQKRIEVKKMVEPPPLKMIEDNLYKDIDSHQCDVLQAITPAVANDMLNCERLETLGDAFLKFAISLALFEAERDVSEGRLTHLKGMIVGNRNLYFCGKKKGLASLLEVQGFSPNDEWVPPGMCVERSVQAVIREAKLNPNCLLNFKMPQEERIKGFLSEQTREVLNDVFFNADDAASPHSCLYTNEQAYTDKNVADSVEALLGVYLKNHGIFGALGVLNWFQVTNLMFSNPSIFTAKPVTAAKGEGNPNQHLLQPDVLEKILNYKFKDRSFLLQALTHATYTRNCITPDYQRLEFIGDALIDFLITVHIFEKCEHLCPGDLTDLRSALVNNITLAALTARNQFHKFLLSTSSSLQECMMRFILHQEERNHVIDDDILFLVEEKHVKIAEAVDVPKALGDIFEALIGAVYLDSGKSIPTTWKVLYNLMSNEIETMHKNIPKNHVRRLYESPNTPVFSSHIESQGVVMVKVEILFKGSTYPFYGFGDNKHEAKRAAAKQALRFIRTPSASE